MSVKVTPVPRIIYFAYKDLSNMTFGKNSVFRFSLIKQIEALIYRDARLYHSFKIAVAVVYSVDNSRPLCLHHRDSTARAYRFLRFWFKSVSGVNYLFYKTIHFTKHKYSTRIFTVHCCQ